MIATDDPIANLRRNVLRWTFEQFCEKAGLSPKSISAQDKWRAAQNAVAALGELDRNTLDAVTRKDN